MLMFSIDASSRPTDVGLLLSHVYGNNNESRAKGLFSKRTWIIIEPEIDNTYGVIYL